VLMGCTATSPVFVASNGRRTGSTSKSRAKAIEHGGRAQHAGGVGDELRQFGCHSGQHRPRTFRTLENDLEIYLRLRVDQSRKACSMRG